MIFKQKIIIFLGIFIAIIPFLGFPGTWKSVFIVVSGIVVVVLSILIVAKERIKNTEKNIIEKEEPVISLDVKNKEEPVLLDVKNNDVNNIDGTGSEVVERERDESR